MAQKGKILLNPWILGLAGLLLAALIITAVVFLIIWIFSSPELEFVDFPINNVFSIPMGQLCNAKTGKCLDNDTVEGTKSSARSTVWKFIPSDKITEMYLCNSLTNNCLENGGDTTEGKKVGAFPNDHSSNKRWRTLIQTTDDFMTPLWCNVATGRCLEGKEDGTVIASKMTHDKSKLWAGSMKVDPNDNQHRLPNSLANFDNLVDVDMSSQYPYILSNTESKICNSTTKNCINTDTGDGIKIVDPSSAENWTTVLADANPRMYLICNPGGCLEDSDGKLATTRVNNGDSFKSFWRPMANSKRASDVSWCNAATGLCIEGSSDSVKLAQPVDNPYQKWKL